MSIYAVVRETIRSTTGLTKAQIAAKTGSEQVATDPMVDRLVTEGLVTKTGIDAAAATVTMTIADPGVITLAAHGFANDQRVKFATDDALPTGVVAGTWYWTVEKDTNTFQIAATKGGAAIETTGSQAGAHTVTANATYAAKRHGAGTHPTEE